MNPLLTVSGTRLARMIRDREVTSLEALEVHVDRLLKVNPVINALVAARFEEARREARAADDRVASGDVAGLPPFHGVPCTIKECFALKGMPQTSGMACRRGFLPERDATGVARLRAAGAIPLGVSNVSELCMWWETANTVYGRTRNPYDPSRIPGGSSGGEGALVGAGASPFGLGADIGGSIRMPAFFNGVFGHKPTGGLVPGTGQYPIAANQALRYLTTGPITRCAEDLMPLLRVLAGPDGEDAGCKAFTLGDPAAVDMGQVRVVVIPGDGLHPVTPDLRRAQQRAAQTLRELGAHVEERTLPSLRWAIPIWSSMLQAAGGASFSELLGNGQPVSALHELKLWVRGQSTHTFPAIGLAGLESVTKRFPAGLDQMVRRGQALKQELLDLMGPQGVILFPPHPRPAPRHHEPILRPFSYIFTAIFNVMELPATQVPMGLNPRGLPLGVQVVGAHGNDHLTIRVAMELERRHGGWVPPPLPDH